jgi:hypothetical protein
MGFLLIFVQKNPNDGISVNFCEVYRARRKLLNFRVRAWTPTEVPYILPPRGSFLTSVEPTEVS